LNSNHYKSTAPVDGFTASAYAPSQRRSIQPPPPAAAAAPGDSAPAAKKPAKKSPTAVTFDGLASLDRPLVAGQIVVNPKGLLMAVLAIQVDADRDGQRAWVSGSNKHVRRQERCPRRLLPMRHFAISSLCRYFLVCCSCCGSWNSNWCTARRYR